MVIHRWLIRASSSIPWGHLAPDDSEVSRPHPADCRRPASPSHPREASLHLFPDPLHDGQVSVCQCVLGLRKEPRGGLPPSHPGSDVSAEALRGTWASQQVPEAGPQALKRGNGGLPSTEMTQACTPFTPFTPTATLKAPFVPTGSSSPE